MNLMTLLEAGEKIVVISGGLAACCLALKRYTDRLDAHLNGKWTNEGDITLVTTHYMDLELEAEDGEVSGVINSRRLSDDTEMRYVSIVGKRFLWWIRLELLDVKLGSLVSFGHVRCRLKKRNMSWRLTGNTSSEFFPKSTPLWKMDWETAPKSSSHANRQR
jgi:hypothetical protein